MPWNDNFQSIVNCSGSIKNLENKDCNSNAGEVSMIAAWTKLCCNFFWKWGHSDLFSNLFWSNHKGKSVPVEFNPRSSINQSVLSTDTINRQAVFRKYFFVLQHPEWGEKKGILMAFFRSRKTSKVQTTVAVWFEEGNKAIIFLTARACTGLLVSAELLLLGRTVWWFVGLVASRTFSLQMQTHLCCSVWAPFPQLHALNNQWSGKQQTGRS